MSAAANSIKVAVVTGGNKGIGFAIVRGLCKQFTGDVYLTARDTARGEIAVSELNKEGLHPKFRQMDLLDEKSIQKMGEFLSAKYGGLDLLVNNAGIAYKNDSTAPFAEQAEVTLQTNYFGQLNVCKVMFPLLKAHARVVHISSLLSARAARHCSRELQQKFQQCQTVDEVSRLMTQFVQSAKAGNVKDHGWPDSEMSAYATSKLGVTVITPIQQRVFDEDKSRQDIVINACCPGYVATDLTSFQGRKTIDQGAETPLYLALLPPDIKEPRGAFVSERVIKKIWK